MEHLRIKELLIEKGMTGKQLAEKANISTVSVSHIVNGNQFPKPEVLKAIAEALGVSLKDLFTAEDDMQPIYIKDRETYIKIGEIKRELMRKK